MQIINRLKNISLIFVIFGLLFGGLQIVPKLQIEAAGNNLISNPSAETASSDPTLPLDWSQDFWGRMKKNFSYPVAGIDGQNAMKVEITQYWRGDAKWTFKDVSVTGGQTYAFSDYYKSNIVSTLVVRYLNSNNRYVYVDIATLDPSAEWKQTNNTFTAPNNAVSATVYHLISEPGWLVTDNFSMSQVNNSTPTPNLPSSTPIIIKPTNTPTSVVLPTSTLTPTPTDIVIISNTPTPILTETPGQSPTPTTLTPTTPPVDTVTPTTTPPINTITPTQTPNNGGLIANGSLENSSNGIAPDFWYTGSWGTNSVNFSYPVVGIDGAKAAKLDITQYTDGDAKWFFADVAVKPGSSYIFADSYQSNVTSLLVIRYKNQSTGAYSYAELAALAPANNWTNTSKTFTVPNGVESITIFHLINSVGSLTVDKFSLTEVPPPPAFTKGMVSLDFDDGWLSTFENGIPILNSAGFKSTQYIITGYMQNAPEYVTTSQVLQMAAAGHDIEAHSRTHADLTTVNQIDMISEVCGARQDLIDIGIIPSGFAFPYGSWNQNVIQTVKDCGYSSSRTALIEDGGFNNKDQNPYLLRTMDVEDTTSLSDIKYAIDTAANTKTWLILVLHGVAGDGGQYDTPPAKLQSIVDYLKTSNVDVVTLKQGLERMAN